MKRLFAIGDIHGCFDSLKELVESNIQLDKNEKLILLGDYIDRGNKSKEVVDYIIDLLEKGYDVIPLIGNLNYYFLKHLKTKIINQNGFKMEVPKHCKVLVLAQ